MPIAVPLAIAGAEYGGSFLAGTAATAGLAAAAGTAEDAFILGTGTSAAATAAESAFAFAPAAAGMSGLQLAGLAASTVGGIGQAMQGKAASESAAYNAEIARNNQIIANNNATAAIHEGEQNAASSSQGTKAKIGGILANQGASGVDISSGSSVDTRASAAQTGELNAINIRADAARKAYGYQNEGANAAIQEQMDKASAKNEAASSEVASASTLLSGATNPNNPFGAYLASQSIGG